MARNLLAIVTAAILAAGCGEEDPTQQGPDPEQPWVNQKPVVQIASPGAMAVGDLLTVLGQDFIDPTHGKIYLQFQGDYFDSQGGVSPVDLQVEPTVNLDTDRKVVKSLSWEMWPNIVFHRDGDQLGRFVGHLFALNAGNDGTVEPSDPLPITIDVEPSIIPRVSQPVGSSCGAVVKTTLENQPMAFVAEVVGLRAGTPDAPLTFRWTFRSEEWTLGFANDASIDPTLNPFFTLDPSGVVRPKSGPVVLEQKVTDGSQTSRVGSSWNTSFLVKAASTAGGEPLGTTRVTELSTGAIPAEGGGSSTVTVNVEAEDAAGNTAHLSLRLNLTEVAQLIYDGSFRIAEYFEPKPLSGCTPGGDIGSDLSYSESDSERRDRSVGFNWNANYSVAANLGLWPQTGGLNWGINASLSYGFGVNINESISSDKSISKSLSKHILPGQYGMLYRQTVKIYRVGQMIANTICGQSIPVGDAVLTDWMWSPEIATGPTCPPKSQLPPAQKLED